MNYKRLLNTLPGIWIIPNFIQTATKNGEPEEQRTWRPRTKGLHGQVSRMVLNGSQFESPKQNVLKPFPKMCAAKKRGIIERSRALN